MLIRPRLVHDMIGYRFCYPRKSEHDVLKPLHQKLDHITELAASNFHSLGPNDAALAPACDRHKYLLFKPLLGA